MPGLGVESRDFDSAHMLQRSDAFRPHRGEDSPAVNGPTAVAAEIHLVRSSPEPRSLRQRLLNNEYLRFGISEHGLRRLIRPLRRQRLVLCHRTIFG